MIQKNCSGIIVKIIENENIEEMISIIQKEIARSKTLVHQITGLSCFCDAECEHFKLGTWGFSSRLIKLIVEDV